MLTRHYAKLCEVEDFDDERLLETARSILPERDPGAHIERKVWEFCMLAMLLEDVGALHRGTRVLAVGAGNERILFWLANRVGRVVATDIYGTGLFAGREAEGSMLEDPASHAPFPYDEDRLEVRWMDGRELTFEDGEFDVVFSLSSIEHFGGRREAARAAREIGRVLRPGGHAVIVTECLVRHHPFDFAVVDTVARAVSLGRRMKHAAPWRRVRLSEVFTRRELARHVVEPSGLELLQPLDTSMSAATWENVTRQHRDGRLEPRTGDFHPHVLVQLGHSVFTSVLLPLRKPAA